MLIHVEDIVVMTAIRLIASFMQWSQWLLAFSGTEWTQRDPPTVSINCHAVSQPDIPQSDEYPDANCEHVT